MKKYAFPFSFALLIATFSCDPKNTPPTPAKPVPPYPGATMTQLGKQLENPYSLTNMQRALDTLKHQLERENSPEASIALDLAKRIEIESTNLYVRFLPKDNTEMNRLASDPALDLYDYPLDYEIVKQGDYYHDPTLPANSYTWQYTVIRPDYTFPNIRYEVLKQLFIPENSPQYSKEDAVGGSERPTVTWLLNALETLSLHLTGNSQS